MTDINKIAALHTGDSGMGSDVTGSTSADLTTQSTEPNAATLSDDGGPAFAAAGPLDGDYVPGMSLRDYFAGQALKGAADAVCEDLDAAEGESPLGIAQCYDDARAHAERHARAAYLVADAMLKARRRR